MRASPARREVAPAAVRTPFLVRRSSLATVTAATVGAVGHRVLVDRLARCRHRERIVDTPGQAVRPAAADRAAITPAESASLAPVSEQMDVTPVDAPPVDLDAVAAELDGVERALARLDDGTYWTDEITGAPLPEDVLVASPTARTAAGRDNV